jgi:hypothetical protein
LHEELAAIVVQVLGERGEEAFYGDVAALDISYLDSERDEDTERFTREK